MFARLLRVLACMLGAWLLGLGSVHLALRASQGQANGAWRVWLSPGGPLSSPYVQAHYFRALSLPPDSRQRLDFTAHADSSGARLDARCSYVISGNLPPARWWSLELEGAPAGAISSGRAVLNEDGSLTVHAAALAMPGNWLKLPRGGSFGLVLRFHGPQGQLRRAPLQASLPEIRREDCP